MPSIRKIKDYFYLTSAISSGACLCAMSLLILAQVIARLTGNFIPSSEDFAGWLLSATFFLGFASTFESGGHIRMTMFLSKMPRKNKRRQEIINVLVALIITGYLSYYCIMTVYESFIFEDVTDTFLAIPLWTVQSPMAIGSLFLFLAITDGFIELLNNKMPDFSIQEVEEI